MKTSHAVLTGFALIAAAIYFGQQSPPAQAASATGGYSGHSGVVDNFSVLWRLDTTHGKVSICIPQGGEGGETRAPLCTPWAE